MNFEEEFYKQWKTKSVQNHALFTEGSSFMKERSNYNDQIFTSTALDDQADTETFSLRLSDSETHVTTETQESLHLKSKEKNVNDIILISDSSTDSENNFANQLKQILSPENIKYLKENGVNIIESSDDESLINLKSKTACKGSKQVNSNPKTNMVNHYKQNIIEESDSEIEICEVPQIIKATVAESVTLSDRKKQEILQWLSNNSKNTRCSSCSRDSIVCSSRKSGRSSGNSSLERFELFFETPNNRDKFRNQNNVEKLIKNSQTSSGRQCKIDEFFNKSKRYQLNITKDKTPKSANSNKTLRNVHSNKKPSSCKRIIIPESESFDSLLSQKNVRDDDNRIIVPESESIDSQNNKDENYKKILIPESESFEYKIPDIQKSNTELRAENETSESFHLRIDSDDSNDNNTPVNKPRKKKIIKSQNVSAKEDKESNEIDTTINDCADILENLYGITWRNKASALISATEPKNRTKKKISKEAQTEKKTRKKTLDINSSSELILKRNDEYVQKERGTVSKKHTRKNKVQSSFINDDSTTESSPDCSYYTALSNPAIPSQNSQFGIAPTVPVDDKNKVKTVVLNSDSDCDSYNRKWKKSNQRKLSFDSSSDSSTSEFDPDDIIPPKSITRNLKSKNQNLVPLKAPTVQTQKQNIKKSFLASLSKDVPLDNAEFQAMTYRVKYKTLKEDLCKVLFKLFNEKVFDNQLPHDLLIEWSVRLRGTAGKCFNKQSLKALGKTVRSSRIVLATKILDSPDRLRDTLIHELCHAATWLINNVSDGHGNFWKAWANKAMKVFPELPSISRCHNYVIQTKYTYKCTSCGYCIGRHSKSLDLNRKRCGYCHGTFELLINKITKDGNIQKKSTAQTKEVTGFALYVKENYQTVKKNSTMKHGEVMKILGQQFSAVKLTPKPEARLQNNENESP